MYLEKRRFVPALRTPSGAARANPSTVGSEGGKIRSPAVAEGKTWHCYAPVQVPSCRETKEEEGRGRGGGAGEGVGGGGCLESSAYVL